MEQEEALYKVLKETIIASQNIRFEGDGYSDEWKDEAARRGLTNICHVPELRGAIPIGVAHGLDYRIAIAVSILGNLVPVPFIVLFIRKIFAWLRTKSERLNGFVTRMEQRALKKSDTVRRARFWGLFIFVAIPLPGTGAWTGSLIAAMLEMRVKEAFPPIALGVVTAGIIVAVVTYGAASLLF